MQRFEDCDPPNLPHYASFTKSNHIRTVSYEEKARRTLAFGLIMWNKEVQTCKKERATFKLKFKKAP